MSYLRAFFKKTSIYQFVEEKRLITMQRAVCIGLMLGVYWPTSLYVITYWQVEETLGYIMVVLRAIAILGSALYCFPLFL